MSDIIKLDIGSNVRKQLPIIIIGSLSLITSLAWNDAIQALINQYIPEEYKDSNNAWYKISYALCLTLIIIIVISIILKITNVDIPKKV